MLEAAEAERVAQRAALQRVTDAEVQAQERDLAEQER